MIKPRVSPVFGVYLDDKYLEFKDMENTELYKRDLLGLKRLNDGSKMFRCLVGRE